MRDLTLENPIRGHPRGSHDLTGPAQDPARERARGLRAEIQREYLSRRRLADGRDCAPTRWRGCWTCGSAP